MKLVRTIQPDQPLDISRVPVPMEKQPVQQQAPVSLSFTPSLYQAAIFDFIQHQTSSAIIQAVAGSGKTTTIVEATKLVPAGNLILFLAFNKSIATELGERLPDTVSSATFHSVAFKAWNRFAKGCRVEARKTANLLRTAVEIGFINEEESDVYGSNVIKLVGLAKNAGIGAIVRDTPEQWRNLVDHFDITIEANEDRCLEIAQAVFNASWHKVNARTVDFDDMLYLPLKYNVSFDKYDVIFVDESQDTNRVQRALLRAMLKVGGRLIAVGDRHQAIYGFRGADSSAMDRIADEFDCVELPLSISYRCPQAVVRAAQQYVSGIEASPTAKEGTVQTMGIMKLNAFNPSDVIVCRNTAPLVELAYKFLGNGKGVKVLGRDIGQGLISLIKKMKAPTIDQLEEKLERYQQNETQRLLAKGQEDKAQQADDKVNSLFAAINALEPESRTISALVQRIENIFTDTAGNGLTTLCTVHKSKGLEWPTVYILDHELMPSKWARQQWQQEQEKNLIYVAYTRSKENLFFVSSENIEA